MQHHIQSFCEDKSNGNKSLLQKGIIKERFVRKRLLQKGRIKDL